MANQPNCRFCRGTGHRMSRIIAGTLQHDVAEIFTGGGFDSSHYQEALDRAEEIIELVRTRIGAEEAAHELKSLAEDLKQCSTVGGKWDGSEKEAQEECDRLTALAGRLCA